MMYKAIILICLFAVFLLLFRKVHFLEMINRLLKQTLESMDEATRRRMLQNRRTLLEMQREHSLWFRIERELHFSGLKRKFPWITAENWLAVNLTVGMFVFIAVLVLLKDVRWAFLCMLLLWGAESVILAICKMKALRSVEQNLLKFLDFLGNYSITAGEITGIFHQVSKYVEEPLKSTLEECCSEAQITGDTGLALLSMAEKIEHPKFQEIVRNMEIGFRYSADFKSLVRNSKRSVREYLRMGGERKGMLREATINLLLLIGMSGVILLTVDGLIEANVWHILLLTLPGRLALFVLFLILVLFLGQIYKMNH